MRILYLPNHYSQQRQREKKRTIYPVLMAMEAEWYRKQGHEVYWNPSHDNKWWIFDKIIKEPEGLPFLSLPSPDRMFTKWWHYQDNGNFKYRPGTYIQAANGCWHGKCTFCVEQNNKWEVRPVIDVIDEIIDCKRMGFKEIFDDSGTFPQGEWLNEFCKYFYKLHRTSNIRFSCNWRLYDYNYSTLRRAGFRMLLFGVESANQKTLDKINKGTKVEDIKYIIKAKKAGLDTHVSFMIKYPWETYKEMWNTINLVKWLLIKGYADTAQCSVYLPPEGNPYYYEGKKYVNKIYDVAFNPEFWVRKIINIKNKHDLKYLMRSIKEGINSKWIKQK